MSLRFHDHDTWRAGVNLHIYMNSGAQVKWREYERVYVLVPRIGTAGAAPRWEK